MRGLNKISKKGVMGPVISVFVMVLVISILSGLTFLFVAALKTNVADTTATASATVTNESGAYVNTTGYSLANNNVLGFRSPTIIAVWANVTNGVPVLLLTGNYTVSSTGVLTNVSIPINATQWNMANVSYSYKYISEQTAYKAVNDTEAAGAALVGYLPLIFLAIIFGAILTLVLRIILPYINLGQQMGGF
jgi:hypothetical protein